MRAPTFDALEGGIMGDEHRLRRAQIKHRELDLEGRRVDARIASLESLATQATLLSGFSYAVLRPDSVNGLLAGPVMNTPLGVPSPPWKNEPAAKGHSREGDQVHRRARELIANPPARY